MSDANGRKGKTAGSSTALWLVVTILVAAFALLANTLILMERRDALKKAESDNRTWTMSQLESSYMNLRLKVSRKSEKTVLGEPVDGDRIELAFDILISRLSAFLATIPPERRNAELAAAIVEIQELLAELETQIIALDQPGSENLAALTLALEKGWPVVRETSLAGLMQLIAETEAARRAEKSVLSVYIAISLVLLVMMMTAALLSRRLWGALEQRAEASRRTADMLRRVLDSATDAIVLTDMSGRVRRANPAAIKLLGDDMVPFTTAQRGKIEAPDLDISRFLTEDFAGRIGARRYRSEALAQGGRSIPVDVSVVSTVAVDSKPSMLLFVIRDMTLEDQSERRMRNATEAAAAHAAAKDRFLTAVSHEMRTPLHGLLGAIELLEAEGFAGHPARMLTIARTAALQQLSLVEDILDIARADATRAQAFFSPAKIAADLIAQKRSEIGQSGPSLNLQIAGEPEPGLFRGSAVAFSRVLDKLLQNAIIHCPYGMVSVRLVFAQSGNDATRLDVDVEDDGIGIPAEDQARIFEPFETLGYGSFSARQAAGLGLSVARSLVEAMGGSIEVDSVPGGGSCFRFALTLASAPETSAKTRPGPLPRRVERDGDALIADDNPVNVTLMRYMVERVGFRVSEAMTGGDAVARAKGQRLALIVLDYLMPGLNGLEVARQIRAGGASREATILLVTAVPEQIDPDEAARIGIDAVLPKPVSHKQIAAILQQGSGFPDQTEVAGTDEAKDAGEDSFDFAELCDMLGADTARMLVTEALQDARRALDLLADDTAPCERKAQAVHDAIGSTSMIGFSTLGQGFLDLKKSMGAPGQPSPEHAVSALWALLAQAEGRARPDRPAGTPSLAKAG